MNDPTFLAFQKNTDFFRFSSDLIFNINFQQKNKIFCDRFAVLLVENSRCLWNGQTVWSKEIRRRFKSSQNCKLKTSSATICIRKRWNNNRNMLEGSKRLNVRIAYTRISKRLVQKQKLVLVKNDLQNMYEGDMLYLYNRRNLHTYTSDGAHWTGDMLEKLTPLYKRTVEDLLLRLKDNN